MQRGACAAGAGAQASVMTPSAMAVFVMTLNSSAASHGADKAFSGSHPSQPATTLMENVSHGSVASCLQAWPAAVRGVWPVRFVHRNIGRRGGASRGSPPPR